MELLRYREVAQTAATLDLTLLYFILLYCPLLQHFIFQSVKVNSLCSYNISDKNWNFARKPHNFDTVHTACVSLLHIDSRWFRYELRTLLISLSFSSFINLNLFLLKLSFSRYFRNLNSNNLLIWNWWFRWFTFQHTYSVTTQLKLAQMKFVWIFNPKINNKYYNLNCLLLTSDVKMSMDEDETQVWLRYMSLVL